MSGDDIARAEDVFHSARALPPGEREAHARAACGGDAELLALVLELLAFDEEPHALDHTPSAALWALPAGASSGDVLPERVGRYRVLRRIGAGGMGTVYEAEQEEPRRTVALKVLSHVHPTGEMLARFRREARVLGALQHPGIAQVYEAGTGPLVVGGGAVAEVPFLALELVRGERLLDAVHARAASRTARLELFARLCDALEHAHAQGIVHRDLKPANILVVESGTGSGTGRVPSALLPKVLDFGIARLAADAQRAGEAGREPTLETRTGQVLGTLAYMSPEQARGEGAAIDARADVWALGVILFELLTGRRPFALDGLALPQAARKLEDEDPTRLSSLDTSLRGDLDVIVAKALEKEPARRYAHAGELAADVRRHLADEPIRARPASAAYVLRKYARRHRAVVFAVATGLAALVGGLGYGLWREHERRVEAEAVTAFLLDVLKAPSAITGKRDITLLEALERFEPEIDARFAGTPDLQQRLLLAFGDAYNSLQRYDRGKPLLERALAAAVAAHGAHSREAMALRSEIALIDSATADVGRAAEDLETLWAEQRDRLGAMDIDARRTRLRLADARRTLGEVGVAEALYRELLATPPLASEGAEALHPSARLGLAEVLMELRRFEESEEHFDAAIEALDRMLGPDHARSLGARHSLAVLRGYQERIDEAQAIEERVLLDAERVLGPDSTLVLLCLNDLATLEFQRGNFARAKELLAASAERTARSLGPMHADTLAARNNLAAACMRLNEVEDARAIWADIAERARTTHGDDAWIPWVFLAQEGQALLELGHAADAEGKLRAAHAGLERLLGAADDRTRGVAGFVGRACAAQGRADEAAAWKERSRRAAPPSTHD